MEAESKVRHHDIRRAQRAVNVEESGRDAS
jgi:hypothetical protein